MYSKEIEKIVNELSNNLRKKQLYFKKYSKKN